MSRWILALDQGTSSCRSVLFDRQGTPVALAQRAQFGAEKVSLANQAGHGGSISVNFTLLNF